MNDSKPMPEDAELDGLLQSWAHQTAVDSARLQNLHDRIKAATMQVSFPRGRESSAGVIPVQSRVLPQSPGRRVHSTSWVVASCLLAVILAGVVVPMGNFKVTRTDEHSRIAKLWKETSQLFGRDLDWLCDLDGELVLGVGQHDQPVDSDPIDVSLTVRVFDPATQKWLEAWSGRIACRGGTTVDFASSDRRATGSVWVQTRPDGKFAVSHWLSWQDHPEVSGPIEGTAASGESTVVADRIKDGHHIQVVQQIWRPRIG